MVVLALFFPPKNLIFSDDCSLKQFEEVNGLACKVNTMNSKTPDERETAHTYTNVCISTFHAGGELGTPLRTADKEKRTLDHRQNAGATQSL